MACTTTPFKSHMELLEKMQNSPSPELNDGLTSKAKHEVFEGVLSALARSSINQSFSKTGGTKPLRIIARLSKAHPRWKHLSRLLLPFSRISRPLMLASFIKARGELQAVRRSAQPISRTKLPTDLGGFSKMFMMAVQRHSLGFNPAISC